MPVVNLKELFGDTNLPLTTTASQLETTLNKTMIISKKVLSICEH